MQRPVENEDKQVFGKSLMFRAALGFILSRRGDGRWCLKLQPVVVYLLIKTKTVGRGGEFGPVWGSERVPTSWFVARWAFSAAVNTQSTVNHQRRHNLPIKTFAELLQAVPDSNVGNLTPLATISTTSSEKPAPQQILTQPRYSSSDVQYTCSLQSTAMKLNWFAVTRTSSISMFFHEGFQTNTHTWHKPMSQTLKVTRWSKNKPPPFTQVARTWKGSQAVHLEGLRAVCGICVSGVPTRCARRAIWSAVPGRGACEVLSAWLLRCPVATEGLLHGTSSPRQPTSEKEIWVAQMEGLLPELFQSLPPLQRHPRYSIWEPTCIHARASACVCRLGLGRWQGVLVCVEPGTFMRSLGLSSWFLQARVVCPGAQRHACKMVY